MKIKIEKGDITTYAVDAIVNAANTSLLGGGGVDGAIHRAAGRQLYDECRKLNGCATGQAKITAGYNLPAKYVIHTVGPIWGNYIPTPQTESKYNKLVSDLESCYRSSLELAANWSCKTIAFPGISIGVYNFPVELATSIAFDTLMEFSKQKPDAFDEVTFVCFSDDVYNVYIKVAKEMGLV